MFRRQQTACIVNDMEANVMAEMAHPYSEVLHPRMQEVDSTMTRYHSFTIQRGYHMLMRIKDT